MADKKVTQLISYFIICRVEVPTKGEMAGDILFHGN